MFTYNRYNFFISHSNSHEGRYMIEAVSETNGFTFWTNDPEFIDYCQCDNEKRSREARRSLYNLMQGKRTYYDYKGRKKLISGTRQYL